MKVLVYGAGNIGSLYAVLLARSGVDVSILARGARLEEIRDRGIELRSLETGESTLHAVPVVERLAVDDVYDLVLVVLPKHSISDVLPALSANRKTPSVMFFGNNAAGPEEWVESLGRDRVLLGFPGAAAVEAHGALSYVITSAREQPTTLGELDGSISPRIRAIAEVFSEAGFPVAISKDMDAWLKTHVAEILPSVLALYMCGIDTDRLRRTRDGLVLLVRAIREAYRVLRVSGTAVMPRSHRVFEWLPEPLLVLVMRQWLAGEDAAIKVGHALAARPEMQRLDDEFRLLTAPTGVPTPALDRLRTHLDPRCEPLPDGSADLSLRWGSVWALTIAVAGLVGLGVALW